LLEKGADGLIGDAAECARSHVRWDIADAFHTHPIRGVTGPIEDIKSNVATGIHCVDRLGVLVDNQEHTGQGPEGCGRYLLSFNVYGIMPMARKGTDKRGISTPVNRTDVTALARKDHSEAKCARFVELNRAVVRELASTSPEPCEVFKQGDGTCRRRELKDERAFCDEKVPRGKPGRSGQSWSDRHVFFRALFAAKRNQPQQRLLSRAVEPKQTLAAPLSRVQRSRGNGYTRGFVQWGKEICTGAINRSCDER
jgi:hypothetical protein